MSRVRKAKAALKRARPKAAPEQVLATVEAVIQAVRDWNATLVEMTDTAVEMRRRFDVAAGGKAPELEATVAHDKLGKQVKGNDLVRLPDGSTARVERASLRAEGPNRWVDYLRVQLQDGFEDVRADTCTLVAQAPSAAPQIFQVVALDGDTVRLRSGETATVDGWSLTRTARGFPKAYQVVVGDRRRWVMLGDVVGIVTLARFPALSTGEAPHDTKVNKRNQEGLGVYRRRGQI